MKLRSIALAGLLGAGLLMTSGCNEDAIEDVLGVTEKAVWVVNGYATEAIIPVIEGTDKASLPKGDITAFTSLDSGDTFRVAYKVNASLKGEEHLAASTVHAYIAVDPGATGCSSDHITHPLDSNHLVQVVNLQGTTLTNTALSVTIDGAEKIPVGDVATACQKTALAVNTTIGTIIVTVNGNDPVEEDITKDYAVDVVILPDGTAIIVPLLGFDDILNK